MRFKVTTAAILIANNDQGYNNNKKKNNELKQNYSTIEPMQNMNM